jgi:hypothetical protein
MTGVSEGGRKRHRGGEPQHGGLGRAIRALFIALII